MGKYRTSGKLRSYMLARLEDHRAQGDTLVLATASNSILSQPIAGLLKVDHLICSSMKLHDRMLTGELLEAAPFRDGKANNIKKWAATNGMTLAGSWGYSDSHNDLPILMLVEHPVAVTPDAILRRHSLENHWQIIEKPE